MFAWWSEVVHEGQTGDHTPVVRIGLRYGFILFIMSEVMFFSAWFWTFFKHRCIRWGRKAPGSMASGRPPGSRPSTPGTCR
jgi:cytochrome c oxidase subunit 3